MHYSQIKLPKERDKLISCYIYLSARLRHLWIEYVSFAEDIDALTSPDVFQLLFSEMDFFEGLRARVAKRLPSEVTKILRNVNDYSGW